MEIGIEFETVAIERPLVWRMYEDLKPSRSSELRNGRPAAALSRPRPHPELGAAVEPGPIKAIKRA